MRGVVDYLEDAEAQSAGKLIVLEFERSTAVWLQSYGKQRAGPNNALEILARAFRETSAR